LCVVCLCTVPASRFTANLWRLEGEAEQSPIMLARVAGVCRDQYMCVRWEAAGWL